MVRLSFLNGAMTPHNHSKWRERQRGSDRCCHENEHVCVRDKDTYYPVPPSGHTHQHCQHTHTLPHTQSHSALRHRESAPFDLSAACRSGLHRGLAGQSAEGSGGSPCIPSLPGRISQWSVKGARRGWRFHQTEGSYLCAHPSCRCLRDTGKGDSS